MNVGIYSGSFNPIHMGHLMLANYVLEYSQLDEIWFLVTPQNPWKEDKELLNENDRYEMVRLALKDYPQMKVSDLEFNLPRPSYTENTLNELAKTHPEINFSLIIGADNWEYFGEWRNYQSILDNYPIYVYPRLGYNIEDANAYKGVTIVKTPILEISSTLIRDAISQQKDLKAFLPTNVHHYIVENKIYQK